VNNSRELSHNNPRVNSVEYLITVGLGYCCEALFWEMYRDVGVDIIAARLGVSERTVRRHLQTQGERSCAKVGNCLGKEIK